MWAFLLVAVVFILGRYFYDKEQQKHHLLQEGGMKRKYNTLIMSVLALSPEHALVNNKADLLQYSIKIQDGVILYTFMENFGYIKILWEMQSVTFGKRILEWNFPEYQDQEQMLIKMNQDISVELKKMMSDMSYPTKEELINSLVTKMTNDALKAYKSNNNNETWLGALAIEKSLMNNVEYFNSISDELAVDYGLDEQEVKSLINQSFRKVHGQFIEKRPY